MTIKFASGLASCDFKPAMISHFTEEGLYASDHLILIRQMTEEGLILSEPSQGRATNAQDYKIDLPKSVPMSSSASTVDDLSVSILKRYHPVILESHVPVEVCGDGNYLFRAVSKGLRNTEEHYMQIRLLTTFELILNRSRYDYEHEAFVDHFNDDRLVFGCFDTVLKDIATV
ncbi:hypothetical protein PoB_005340500 [Plakobranchus ocellatus]|uniref:Uncharacterized protein n=1 Tax=Plakobranchus ocellatus TaxID=259542 RepID=A0AAV4C5G0_9GAST|nr:hypothetical protein PoB_005340500 [Plakobranchus ocellatus]